MDKKIRSFTDLHTWQTSYQLVLMIYNSTKHFPKEELFGLVSQMRRAAVSISSNIAEGFARQSYKEKIQFYYIAQSSNVELQNLLLIAKDVSYLNKQGFNQLAEQSIKVKKLLSGLIKKSKSFSH